MVPRVSGARARRLPSRGARHAAPRSAARAARARRGARSWRTGVRHVNVNVRDLAAERAAQANCRAALMRQFRQWHWISGAVCLVSMLLFAVTGITLNHSAAIEARPETTTQEATLDEAA